MSTIIKPPYWMRLNKGHPLARDLVGCWLMNEGTGSRIHNLADPSGQTDTDGSFYGSAEWSKSKFGHCMNFPSTDGYLKVLANDLLEGFWALTLLAWINPTATPGGSHGRIVHKANGSTSDDYHLSYYAGDSLVFRIRTSSGIITKYGTTGSLPENTGWHQAVGVYDGSNMYIYLDGLMDPVGATAKTGTVYNNNEDLGIGKHISSDSRDFRGFIDHVMIFKTALSAEEINHLYRREPFCMFERAGGVVLISAPAAEVSLAGSITAQSTASATLESICIAPKIEINWLTDALFNGMTANAFKLGTTLTLGWFWVRVVGCSVLYRGSGMKQIDFTNILTVTEMNASHISPPNYIPHNPSSTYFYIVRRFNERGYQEQSLTAAVKVSIDSSGDLAQPQPNKVFAAKAEQVDGNKIRLVWFYCPIEQQTPPACFCIYYDERTGQINYDNPIATIDYKGRKLYSYMSDALEAGRYLFAIRAKDADGIENSTLAKLNIQIDNANPNPIEILSATSF